MELIASLAPHLPWLMFLCLPLLLLSGFPVAFNLLIIAILAGTLGQMSGLLPPELAAAAPNRLIGQLIESDWPLSLLLMTVFALAIGSLVPKPGPVPAHASLKAAKPGRNKIANQCAGWMTDGRVRFLVSSGAALVLLSHMLAIPLGLVYMAATLPAFIIYLLHWLDKQVTNWGRETNIQDGETKLLMRMGSDLKLPLLLMLPAGLQATGIWTIEQALCLASVAAWLVSRLTIRPRERRPLWMQGSDSLIAAADIALIALASLTFLFVFADVGGNAWLAQHAAIEALENWGLIGLCLAVLMVLAFLLPWPLVLIMGLSLLSPQITQLDGTILSSTLAQIVQNSGPEVISTPARLWLATLLWLCFQPPILVQTLLKQKSWAQGLALPGGKTHNASKAILSLIVIILIVLSALLLMPRMALLLPYSVFA